MSRGCRSHPCGAAALSDALLQELDQFVLVLDHVTAQMLEEGGEGRHAAVSNGQVQEN